MQTLLQVFYSAGAIATLAFVAAFLALFRKLACETSDYVPFRQARIYVWRVCTALGVGCDYYH